MKSVVLFIGLFVLSSVALKKCESSNSEDRIVWSDKTKLTWKDFKGKPVKNETYKAMTYVGIDYSHEDLDHSYSFNISCYFIPSLSWSKSKSKNETSQWLLEHEQLHFDIAELHARKIRKTLASHKSYSGSESTIFLDSINELYYKVELLDMNTSYDEETAHGTIREKQKEWEKKIENELYKLRRYADPKVNVPRIIVVNN